MTNYGMIIALLFFFNFSAILILTFNGEQIVWKLINLNNGLEVFVGDVVRDKNGLSYIVLNIYQPVNNIPQNKISYKKLTKSGIKESDISKFKLDWKWI